MATMIKPTVTIVVAMNGERIGENVLINLDHVITVSTFCSGGDRPCIEFRTSDSGLVRWYYLQSEQDICDKDYNRILRRGGL